ncbi:MAG: hypothetical protein JXR49_00150 [Acidobacteria bacterium]|nr:hypothetical protein [Acidobacteriota bacterium]
MIPIAIILTFFLGNPTVMETRKDLPDLDTFLRNVQNNLRSDRLLQSRYTFNMKQSDIELDKEGNTKVFLLKKIKINRIIEFSDYRKFRVRTSFSFSKIEEENPSD